MHNQEGSTTFQGGKRLTLKEMTQWLLSENWEPLTPIFSLKKKKELS